MLVVIAVVSFAVLLLTGPRAMWTAWRSRGRADSGRPADAGDVPDTPRDALMVEIVGDPRWESWRHLVLLLAVQVKVTNTTDSPILVAGYGFTYDAPDGRLWKAGLGQDEIVSVDREVRARQEETPYRYGAPLEAREIPARSTVSGWRVFPVTRKVGGGTPCCTVVVTDDIGNQYTAVIPAQQPRRVYPSERRDPEPKPPLTSGPDRGTV